jgi:hypothetical protein
MRREEFVPLILVFTLPATLAAQARVPAAQPSGSAPSVAAQTKPSNGSGLSTDASGIVSHEQIVAVVRKVAENDLANDVKARDYTYTERTEKQTLDRKGNVTSTDSKTYDVTVLYDKPVETLVAKNGEPLPRDEVDKEERRVEKLIRKREAESPAERQKRVESDEQQRRKDREFELEVADAYDFRLLGTQRINGRRAWVLDGTPRPGFRARQRQARILSNFRIRVWIDQTAMEWVKLDAQAINTVSWGVFLARVQKGSRIEIEQTLVDHDVWLPKHVAVKVDARVALIKRYDFDLDVAFSDYKKFLVNTKTLPAKEVQE